MAPDYGFLAILCIPAAAGVASHLTYFIRGEHHLWSSFYTKIATVSFALSTAAIWIFHAVSLLEATTVTFCIFAVYVVLLFTSLIIYRLYFHPLRRCPGPLSLKISQLASIWINRNFDGYLQVEKLRRRYGDVVRTGPNELTFFNSVKAYDDIYGSASKSVRGAYWDGQHPDLPIQGIRDKAAHTKRRRVWDHAFSAKGRSLFRVLPSSPIPLVVT